MVSQPPGFESINKFLNYVYRSDVKVDRDIFVYHVKQGFNQDHEDFRGRQIEWLYTKWKRDSSTPEYTQHSTCTASKVIGNIYGTAKFATLVVVRMADLTPAFLVKAFRVIVYDIRDKHR